MNRLQFREEGHIPVFHCGQEERTVEIAITPFTGGLRREQTGMTGRAIEAITVAVWLMARTEGVRSAPANALQRTVDMVSEPFWRAKTHQPTERPFTIGRGGIEQNTGHWPTRVFAVARVDAFAETGHAIAGLQRELAHQRMRERV